MMIDPPRKLLTVAEILAASKGGNAYTRALDARIHVLCEERRTWAWAEHELSKPLEQPDINLSKPADLRSQDDG
jgi:hypothetical protein